MSFYHPATYDPAITAQSIWEDTATTAPVDAQCPPLCQDEICDIAIIGAGYTGLSAALHLAREEHADVCVIDAAMPGWGASGRNGGFCCMGSAKLDFTGMRRRYGGEATRAFFNTQRAAVSLVRALSTEEGIDISAQGMGEIELAHRPSAFAAQQAEHALLSTAFGYKTTLYDADALAELGVGGTFYGAHHIPDGFGLHPLDYVRGLAQALVRRGRKIYGHSAVIGWRHENGRHRLVTQKGTVTAKRVIVATNGYGRDELHAGLSGTVLPVLSNIIVTRPLADSEYAAQGWKTETPTSDSRHLVHYFRRLPDGRFLFGGRGGLSGAPHSAPKMKAQLLASFHNLFPAWRNIEITHFWRGLVCLSRDLVPHIGALPRDASVFYALAYHGNGVAMGSWAGRAVAALAAGAKGARNAIPDIMLTPLKRFPFPLLRPLYLHAALSAYHLKDSLS